MFILTQDLQSSVISLVDHPASQSPIDQEHARYIEDRRQAIPETLSLIKAPPRAKILIEEPAPWSTHKHAWRRGITATVFWIGETASERNSSANNASAWDPNWQENYGGIDHPSSRNGFMPKEFKPRLNPFYIALPFDDLTYSFSSDTEHAEMMPWHWSTGQNNGVSLCKGRWVIIHYRGKVCYAQWEDCGPFHTDDWQYVFNGQSPKPNPNGFAGIEVSPAIRDFLGIRSGYRVSWRFAKHDEIPAGPWNQWHVHPELH
ncbi:MAG: hypothetical protein ACPIA7_02030 [Akkermansiaceae bacterium]